MAGLNSDNVLSEIDALWVVPHGFPQQEVDCVSGSPGGAG